jgi:hypothetical protein
VTTNDICRSSSGCHVAVGDVAPSSVYNISVRKGEGI